jgi:hypothetical protein
MSSGLLGRSARLVARPSFIAANDFVAASDMGTILRCAISKLFLEIITLKLVLAGPK